MTEVLQQHSRWSGVQVTTAFDVDILDQRGRLSLTLKHFGESSGDQIGAFFKA